MLNVLLCCPLKGQNVPKLRNDGKAGVFHSNVTSQRSSFSLCDAALRPPAHVQIMAVFSVPAGGGGEISRYH